MVGTLPPTIGVAGASVGPSSCRPRHVFGVECPCVCQHRPCGTRVLVRQRTAAMFLPSALLRR